MNQLRNKTNGKTEAKISFLLLIKSMSETLSNGLLIQHPELAGFIHNQCQPKAVSPKRRKKKSLVGGKGEERARDWRKPGK